MLGLPKSTELTRQLPKKAIYAKFNMNNAAREKFDADISKIMIVNEISSDTTIIEKGENISSFFVLLVSLKRENFDEKNIALLSKLIPQNLLYILEYDGNCRLAIYHTKLICSPVMNAGNCSVKLKGINLDAVWENIVMQVGGINIEGGNTLDEQIAVNERRAKIKKEIARLEKKARSENQPKKKFEIVQQIMKLKEENN